MKIAKASTADMGMALKLCSALEAMDRGFFPDGAEGDNDPEDFDRDDDAHCGQALRHVLDILQCGSIGRVIWGMYVMLDPENKIVDPDADTLEDHPETVAAMADAERYRKVRRGQHWSVIDGIGNTLRAEALDAAVDAAPELPANAEYVADAHNEDVEAIRKPIDIEYMLAVCVPGGSSCDPQAVADSIREYWAKKGGAA